MYKIFCSLLVFVSLMISCAPKSKNIQVKPNVIFILSDDHATNAISAYSKQFEPFFNTPNIDRLAEEGAMLKNMFCTNAICGPSRASIITGKYSHKNGYFKNYRGGRFNADQWTLPKELKKNGYQTALVGKWHLASVPQGFDFYKYHIAHGEQGVYWDPIYNENGKKVEEKGYATNITTEIALNWLQKNDDKPFCMFLQFKAPHREWSPDKKYQDLWEKDSLPMPINFDDNYINREATAGQAHMTMDYLNRRDMKMNPPKELTEKQARKWLDFGNKPNQISKPVNGLSETQLRVWKYQKYIKDYLATIKSVDDNIGRVLNYLDENKLSDNTIVVYVSDQGFFLGEHGWFDKRFMYEEALRMPFLIRYPKQVKSGFQLTDITSNIDIAPTILDMIGAKVPTEVQGKSFFENLKGNTPNDWRESIYYHYYEYPLWHNVQPHYGIRTQKYKLIHYYYHKPIWEFYDLEKDPREMNNLIADSSYKKIIDSLKVELQELKTNYGNEMSYQELKEITDRDFGGLESIKK